VEPLAWTAFHLHRQRSTHAHTHTRRPIDTHRHVHRPRRRIAVPGVVVLLLFAGQRPQVCPAQVPLTVPDVASAFDPPTSTGLTCHECLPFPAGVVSVVNAILQTSLSLPLCINEHPTHAFTKFTKPSLSTPTHMLIPPASLFPALPLYTQVPEQEHRQEPPLLFPACCLQCVRDLRPHR